MDNNETIKNFGDMVEATHKLVQPWKKICTVLACALVAITIVLSGVIFYLVHCAYMEPMEVEQTQDFVVQSQRQAFSSSSSSSVTDGN